MSVTSRILLGFALISVAGWLFLLNPMLDRVERQYLEAAEEPMVDAAEILAAAVSAELAAGGDPVALLRDAMEGAKGRPLAAKIYSLSKDRVTMDVYLTDGRGVVLYDSRHPENVGRSFLHYFDVALTLRGEYGARSSREDESDPESSVMCVGAPVRVGGKTVGVLSVCKPQRSMLLFVRETRDRMRALGATVAAGVLLFGLVFSRWVTRPLRVLTEYARRAGKGERVGAPRLPGSHLRVLGEEIANMRDALENRKYVENYVQTLTHEMKSPVAAIRGAAEILQEDPAPEQRGKFVANIRSEAERLQRLNEQLLALAAIERKAGLDSPQAVDLARLAGRVADHAKSRAEAAEVEMGFEGDTEGAWVLGEEFLLATAAANLLQNALDFSPEGGRVTVRVARDGGRIVLAVEDEGPGVPAYALEKVFQRFYSLPRPDGGRKSSGLGLCLAREVATLHGGEVLLENRPGGVGARAVLSVPAVRRLTV